jgi:1,4-alpha-glucan branching enzyme
MGSEFGQSKEWDHESSLDWDFLNFPEHAGIQQWVKELNRLYTSTPALYDFDFSQEGFEWIDTRDAEQSIISFLRKSHDQCVLIICNFTPVVRHNYRVGVPLSGTWKMLLNSDEQRFGGSGVGCQYVTSESLPHQARPFSITLHLPPLGMCILSLA